MTKTRMVACDLCGGTKQDFLFIAKDRLHGFEGTFTYVQCKRCGLVYMNPQISPDEISEFYPLDYGPHKPKRKNQQDKHVLRNKFKKRPFTTLLLEKLNAHKRLLDVGCGSGSFLHEIKTLTGCEIQGVDLSTTAAKVAKESYDIDIFTGSISECTFPNNYFDVITAWSCLEHVHNPSEVLLKISNLLKNDGLCIISTPNFHSFNSKLFKENWYHLDCPRHLYLYNSRTIARLLEKSGLSIQKIKYDESSKGILGSLQYYFYGDNYNPKHRNRIRGSSILKKIVSPLAKTSALMRQSDVMIIHAEKSI